MNTPNRQMELARASSMSKRRRRSNRVGVSIWWQLANPRVLFLGSVSLILIWMMVLVLNVQLETDLTQQEFLSARSFQFIREDLSEEEIVSNFKKLVQRRLPQSYIHLIEVKLERKDDNQYDYYGWEPLDDDRFLIRGTSSSALGMALNSFCQTNLGINLVSWVSEKKATSSSTEQINAKTLKERQKNSTSRVKWRYDFNQVTWSYSQVWWDWERWERELDWMSLNGVNIALAHVGQEAIWERVFQRLLKGKFDPAQYFTGEVYLSWHRMGNIQRLMGPPSKRWMKQQLVLQHKILQRMKELGIVPILPGFNGYIPLQLVKSVKGIEAEASSFWSGFTDPEFTAVNRLKAGSKYFKQIGEAMIIEQLREYSAHISHLPNRYYSVDSFNEIDPGESDVGIFSKALFDSVASADSQAVIVMQMWSFAHNPLQWTRVRIANFFNTVEKTPMLLLDLHGEKRPQWKRLRDIFENRPNLEIVWTLLHNFGGTEGIAGEAANIVKEALLAVDEGGAKGLGVAMEGIAQNEALYDMVYSIVWRDTGVDSFSIHHWIEQWVTSRYGLGNNLPKRRIVSAWKCAFKHFYARSKELSGWGFKSIVGERPEFNMRTDDFQPTDISYTPLESLRCGKELFYAAESLSHYLSLRGNGMSCLLYDVIDFLRQLVGDVMLELHELIIKTFKSNDAHRFKTLSNAFLKLLRYLDRLLLSHPAWSMNTFLPKKEISGRDYEKHLSQTGMLFTKWHSASPALHSYASRQYGGMIGTLYYSRWKLWFDSLEKSLSSLKEVHSLSREYSKQEDQWLWKLSTLVSELGEKQRADPFEVFSNGFKILFLVKDIFPALYD